MKMKPTITVADNGNLQIHIPMLIRRMRGRKTVIAPQALDGEITGAQEPVQSAVLQALGRAFSWAVKRLRNCRRVRRVGASRTSVPSSATR